MDTIKQYDLDVIKKHNDIENAIKALDNAMIEVYDCLLNSIDYEKSLNSDIKLLNKESSLKKTKKYDSLYNLVEGVICVFDFKNIIIGLGSLICLLYAETRSPWFLASLIGVVPLSEIEKGVLFALLDDLDIKYKNSEKKSADAIEQIEKLDKQLSSQKIETFMLKDMLKQLITKKEELTVILSNLEDEYNEAIMHQESGIVKYTFNENVDEEGKVLVKAFSIN